PGRIVFQDSDTVRKLGPAWRLQREVEATDFVRRHTSLPVPAVLEIHLEPSSDNERGWFVMERLPGSELGVAWPNMSEGARGETIRQLRSYCEQLRNLHLDGA
ncbi:hypothetical protein L209DRAFT_662586, partial [Thermothelomyces heterothallicus CBS 203.75]